MFFTSLKNLVNKGDYLIYIFHGKRGVLRLYYILSLKKTTICEKYLVLF